MKKDKEDISTEENYGSGIYLDTQRWTPQWAEILAKVPSCTPQTGPWPIHLVLPIPERGGTLVVYDQDIVCYSSYNTLTTIYRDDHTMAADYPVTCLTLRKLGAFQKRQHPMINSPHVLVPLGNTDECEWVNPLSIHSVWEEPARTYIKMASGPGIIVKNRKKTIEKYAVNALLALACSERDMNPMVWAYRNSNPLNYLDLLDTPFMNKLSRRRRLRKFPFDEGVYLEEFALRRGHQRILKALKRSGKTDFSFESLTDLLDDDDDDK